jgi:hypothetical protein
MAASKDGSLADNLSCLGIDQDAATLPHARSAQKTQANSLSWTKTIVHAGVPSENVRIG